MKCKIVYEYNGQHEESVAVVVIKLHRHMIEVQGLNEVDAMELEELLTKTTKIKVWSAGGAEKYAKKSIS